jgi:hypothetical protein
MKIALLVTALRAASPAYASIQVYDVSGTDTIWVNSLPCGTPNGFSVPFSSPEHVGNGEDQGRRSVCN